MLPGQFHNNREIRRGIYHYALPERPWSFAFVDQSVETLRGMRPNRFAAGLIGRLGTPEMSAAAAALPFPAVNVHGGLPMAGVPVVGPNSVELGTVAAEMLLDCSPASFGFYGLKGQEFSTLALTGFAERLRQAGQAPVVLEVPPGPLGTRDHAAMVEPWLRGLPKPAAIYCPDDIFAHSLGGYCLQMGLEVPGEVMLLGTNNDEVLCLGVQPPLSSLRLPWFQIGVQAAACLDRMMAGEAPPETPVYLGPPERVERQSTSQVHCRDALVEAAVGRMQATLAAPLRLDELSRQLGCTRRTLEKHFQRTLKRSPLQEQNRLRILELKRLLRHDPRTIEEIAYALGFSSPGYLNEFFHREAGMSPSAYRKTFADFLDPR